MTESDVLNIPVFLEYKNSAGVVVEEPFYKETIYDRIASLEKEGCYGFNKVISGGGGLTISVQISKSSKEVQRAKTFTIT